MQRALGPRMHTDTLKLRLGRDGKPSSITEGLGRDLDAGGRLLPLVLATAHHPDHSTHQSRIEIMATRNLFDGARFLYIVFQNRIEHIVGWQGIRILLI